MQEANEQYVHQGQALEQPGSPALTHETITPEGGRVETKTPSQLVEGPKEWFVSEGVKGEGDMPDWYNPDKYPTVFDQAKHAKVLRDAVARNGNEAVPEEYNINLSKEVAEALNLNNEDADLSLIDNFKAIAKESKISEEGVNKVLDMFGQAIIEENKAYQEAQEAYIQEQIQEIGENAEARRDALMNWAKQNIGEDLLSTFEDSVTSASQFKMWEAVKAKMSQKSNIPGNVGTANPQDSLKRAREIMQSGEWKKNVEAAQEMQALYAQANG